MGDDSGELDELDLLMQEYERQAKADCEAVKQKTKRRRTAAEVTTESLRRPLTKDNKGYQLLEKLGYKEGQGLGAMKQGMTEPLALSSHSHREGLGSFAVKLKPIKERKPSTGEETKQYRQEVSQRRQTKRMTGRLTKARRLIENLDRHLDFERNPFWLPQPPTDKLNSSAIATGSSAVSDSAEPEVDALEALTVDDALQAALAYLREQHSYCFWCGTQYKDAAEMRLRCPGVNEEDHE